MDQAPSRSLRKHRSGPCQSAWRSSPLWCPPLHPSVLAALPSHRTARKRHSPLDSPFPGPLFCPAALPSSALEECAPRRIAQLRDRRRAPVPGSAMGHDRHISARSEVCGRTFCLVVQTHLAGCSCRRTKLRRFGVAEKLLTRFGGQQSSAVFEVGGVGDSLSEALLALRGSAGTSNATAATGYAQQEAAAVATGSRSYHASQPTPVTAFQLFYSPCPVVVHVGF